MDGGTQQSRFTSAVRYREQHLQWKNAKIWFSQDYDTKVTNNPKTRSQVNPFSIRQTEEDTLLGDKQYGLHC